jgi:Spy/CpxP family protein refolding chaperone
MKSLKALLTAIALSVAVSSPLLAQEKKKGGGMTAEQQIERIETAVGTLTADQKSKITAIIAKSREETQAIPKEERKEKGAAIMTKQRADIRAVLTKEQQAKYDSMPTGGGGKKGN